MDLKSHTYDELLALAVINADSPTEENIRFAQQGDHMRNPHNDSHKPKLRSRAEIIADHKLEQGLAVMKGVEDHCAKRRTKSTNW